MKKFIALALSTLLTLATASTYAATGPQSGNNGNMWFQLQSDGFNIRGIKNGSQIKTTYGEQGYHVQAGVDGNYSSSRLSFSSNTTANYNGFRIEQNHGFIDNGKYARIQFDVTNTGNSARKITLGFGTDIMIGSNDRAPIRSDGTGFYMSDGSSLVYDVVCKNDSNITPVDSFWFGHYSSWSSNLTTNIGANASLTGTDSGMALSWQNRTIQPGETVSFKVMIGVSENSIDSGFTTIGNHAFDGCSNLPNLTLPNTISAIGDYAFNGCSRMSLLTLDSAQSSVTLGTNWVPSWTSVRWLR